MAVSITTKLVIFAIALTFMIGYCHGVTGITGVTQVGKNINITYIPSFIQILSNDLVFQGLHTSIKVYCKQTQGMSPIVCNLPSVPNCDEVSIYVTSGVMGGPPPAWWSYPFNCTVVA